MHKHTAVRSVLCPLIQIKQQCNQINMLPYIQKAVLTHRTCSRTMHTDNHPLGSNAIQRIHGLYNYLATASSSLPSNRPLSPSKAISLSFRAPAYNL